MMAVNRSSFVEAEFVAKLSLADPDIDLSNTAFLAKDFFDECQEFPEYGECRLTLGRDIPEDSRCGYFSICGDGSTDQLLICKQFAELFGIHFLWVARSCIPPEDDADHEIMVSNMPVVSLMCHYTLLVPQTISSGAEGLVFSDLEGFSKRGLPMYEAASAMLAMSRTFLVLKYGEALRFHELTPWLREDAELGYDALAAHAARAAAGGARALEAAAKVALTRNVPGQWLTALQPGSAAVTTLALQDAALAPEAVRNWRRAGAVVEPAALAALAAAAARAAGAGRALAGVGPAAAGWAAAGAPGTLGFGGGGNGGGGGQRAAAARGLCALAALAAGAFWGLRRRGERELREQLLAGSRPGEGHPYKQYDLTQQKNIFTDDVKKACKILGTSSRPWGLKLSGRPLGPWGAAALGRAAAGRGNALVALTLDKCGIGPRGCIELCSGMRKAPCRLKFLGLRGNDIQAAGAICLGETLRENSSLNSLDISENDIKDEGFSALCQNLAFNHSLLKLEAQKNGITESGAEAISLCLLQNHCLRTIDLKKNKIGPKGGESLASSLRFNKGIKRIRLQENGIGEMAAVAVVSVVQKTNILADLQLRDNGVDLKCCGALAQCLLVNSSLVNLDLYKNMVDDEGLGSLSEGLVNNSSLKFLSLRSNGFGYMGVEQLCRSLETNQCLEGLDISNNPIGDEGAVSLCKMLNQNSTLQVLSADNTDIGTAGARAFAATLPGATLRELGLGGNDLGKDGIAEIGLSLAQNSNLESLSLSDTEMKSSGAKSIAQGLEENATLQYLNVGDNPMIGDSGRRALQSIFERHPTLETVKCDPPRGSRTKSFSGSLKRRLRGAAAATAAAASGPSLSHHSDSFGGQLLASFTQSFGFAGTGAAAARNGAGASPPTRPPPPPPARSGGSAGASAGAGGFLALLFGGAGGGSGGGMATPGSATSSRRSSWSSLRDSFSATAAGGGNGAATPPRSRKPSGSAGSSWWLRRVRPPSAQSASAAGDEGAAADALLSPGALSARGGKDGGSGLPETGGGESLGGGHKGEVSGTGAPCKKAGVEGGGKVKGVPLAPLVVDEGNGAYSSDSCPGSYEPGLGSCRHDPDITTPVVADEQGGALKKHFDTSVI